MHFLGTCWFQCEIIQEITGKKRKGSVSISHAKFCYFLTILVFLIYFKDERKIYHLIMHVMKRELL